MATGAEGTLGVPKGTLAEEILNSIYAFINGVRDSIVGCMNACKIALKNRKIRGKVSLCFILNGLILALSILTFEHIVLPFVLLLTRLTAGLFKQDTESNASLEWVESIISYIFTGLWILPMFVISTPVNSFWFREIAVEAGKYIQKLEKSKQPTYKWNIKALITDLLYGIAIEVVYAIQTAIVSLLPYFGWIISFVLMSLLYSLYSFEYRWFYDGVSVQKRIHLIETRWPYFLGYGFLISLLTSTPVLSPFAAGDPSIRHNVGNLVLSTCIFAIIFPLMILGSFTLKSPFTYPSFNRIQFFKLSRIICNKLLKLLPKSQ